MGKHNSKKKKAAEKGIACTRGTYLNVGPTMQFKLACQLSRTDENFQYQCQCPPVARSLTPRTKTPCSLRFAKKMDRGGRMMGVVQGVGWGWGWRYDNKGKKTWGRERGKVEEGITKLKTNVISPAAEVKQCLLLGGACLAACFRRWVQHCGMTLLLNVSCWRSRQILGRSVCTGKRSGDNRVD